MPTPTEIDQRIADFKESLRKQSVETLVDTWIIQGPPIAIEAAKWDALKGKIADVTKIPAESIQLVGSAKLGFSISEKKQNGQIVGERYRHFGDASDLDVALVSTSLFDGIWQELFKFHCENNPWRKQAEFESYFFRGWIRPDKFPRGASDGAMAVSDVIRNISRDRSMTDHPVNVGIYKNLDFLKLYHQVAVRKCQQLEG